MEEMQAYVRTNVRHHLDENLGIVSELGRYAYEVHYLALAGMPRSYFFDTSRFRDHFIETGIISEESANALFDAAGRVLALYAIDETRFTLPTTAQSASEAGIPEPRRAPSAELISSNAGVPAVGAMRGG
jgi:hypothetical protein